MTKHALPVLWDGDPIKWGDWYAEDQIITHPAGGCKDYYVCPQCHTTSHPRSVTGLVERGLGNPAISLYLRRCMTCGYTTIISHELTRDAKGHEWVLTDDDYDDDGVKTVHLTKDHDPAYKSLANTLLYLQMARIELSNHLALAKYGLNATSQLAKHVDTVVADCTDIVRKYQEQRLKHLKSEQNEQKY